MYLQFEMMHPCEKIKYHTDAATSVEAMHHILCSMRTTSCALNQVSTFISRRTYRGQCTKGIFLCIFHPCDAGQALVLGNTYIHIYICIDTHYHACVGNMQCPNTSQALPRACVATRSTGTFCGCIVHVGRQAFVT